MSYTEDFKQSIIKKSLLPGGPSIAEQARENNLVTKTVYGWKRKYANQSVMKNSKKWTPEQKLKAIVETSSLLGNDLGEYLRQHGLHSSELKKWKEDFFKSQKIVGRPVVDPEIKKLFVVGKLV